MKEDIAALDTFPKLLMHHARVRDDAKLKELERAAAELSSRFEQTAKETIEDLSQKALLQQE